MHPPSGPIFDIGGGNGYVTKAIQKAGYGCILVEPSLEAINHAVSSGLSPVINSSLRQAGFKKNSLPAIGLFDVLEHIENDTELLNDCAEILKPGGMLYITVPAFNFLWSKEDDYAQHKRRYTLRNLSTKLTASGYEIKLRKYIFWFLPVPIFIFRVIPTLLGFRKTPTLNQELKDHRPPRGIFKLILNFLLYIELFFLIKVNNFLGGSCLIAAKLRRQD